LPIDTVFVPPVITPPTPPQPVVPVIDLPVSQQFDFVFYGVQCRVRLAENQQFRLPDTKEETLARQWEQLSTSGCNNLINDCLALRDSLLLCDWAYLQMLETLSNDFLGASTNESLFLQFFLFTQSGYKTRIGQDDRGRLYLLYASDFNIYNKKYYNINGEQFYLTKDLSGNNSLYILDQPYDKEQTMSLFIPYAQKFAEKKSNERKLVSARYPDASAEIYTNKNLIDFYNTYPASTLNHDFSIRWSFYANTPLSDNVKKLLYPALKKSIEGKSEEDAANVLLNFVQTAFVYRYDDEIWGGDRSFFAEETLHYPYSDCEDRAILFSRLVHDLMGAKAVLLYYPGHLATAINFKTDIKGDYLMLDGTRYLVCDPTFIGAPIGLTMTGFEDEKITVIKLRLDK